MPKLNICPICAIGRLSNVNGEFQTEVDGPRGTRMMLTVPNVSWQHCNSCDEDILDDTASLTISSAHRAALGLLTAEEIRSVRRLLGKTQAEMSELLGIGEKTYCRWESGTHFQSEAFDRYLRVLRAAPEMVVLLNDIRLQKEGPRESPLAKFKYLANVSGYESLGERFTQMLQVGLFQTRLVQVPSCSP